MEQEIISEEEVAQHYSAALDSVNLIRSLAGQETLTEEDQERIVANKAHLQIMLKKSFWTDQDLTPFVEAIAL